MSARVVHHARGSVLLVRSWLWAVGCPDDGEVQMNVLYATDGSEGALAAAQFLTTLPPGDQLRLVTVASEPDCGEALHALEVTRQALGERGVGRLETRCGDAAEEILRAAEEEETDLVVVGSHGLGAVGRLLLGSVAERVARRARCPVLLARPLKDDVKTVIIGLDGSQGAAAAARWLGQLPLPPDCVVHVVTAAIFYCSPGENPPERAAALALLESCAEELRRAGKQTSTELREDGAVAGLLAAATEHGADLIVVGAQGLNAVQRFLLGSVSEKVMRLAPCSVLVVRETGGKGTSRGSLR